ncbi:flagellar hook capping FlgD N-terminal domain-containing protein [Pelagicoccus albus]|uniref:Basal-body rod modification protein FlgD n=1 Tax=Pelagicoccus albus TaxID=415222 RepID=A0A7X1B5J1_9BACT|nr:flagellar hook capping FlgD N-terminal domain-containing protein [Pelagicoccus albus]MBC2606010.1 hypothetical protein [Pelagicoccus albus]
MAVKDVRDRLEHDIDPDQPMTTEAISTAQSLANVTSTSSTSSTEERLETESLGQDEFFQLLTTQLASQDPLEPMEDTAFIAQMAAFSQLEMTSEMAESFASFNETQAFASAQGLLGKTVSFSSGETGEVTSVERQNDETLLFLDGSNSNGLTVDGVYKVEGGVTVTSSAQLTQDEG